LRAAQPKIASRADLVELEKLGTSRKSGLQKICYSVSSWDIDEYVTESLIIIKSPKSNTKRKGQKRKGKRAKGRQKEAKKRKKLLRWWKHLVGRSKEAPRPSDCHFEKLERQIIDYKAKLHQSWLTGIKMLHTHKYLVQLRQKLKQGMHIQVYAQLLLVVLRLQLH